jgi:hypothetical protein
VDSSENIPFLNSVKYLGVIFDKTITVEARAFRTFIGIYLLFKSK